MNLLHFALLGLALATSPIATAGRADVDVAAPADGVNVRFTVATDVGADGAVTGVTFTDQVPAFVRPLLEREIRSWQFEPARVGQNAVPSRTHVHLGLHAEPVDGNDLRLRIRSVSNGPGMLKNVAPRYPVEALKSRVSARMAFTVRFDANGAVTDVVADEIVSSGRKRIENLLIDAGMAAVRDWKLIPEQVDGKPIAGTVTAPISFCITSGRDRKGCQSDDGANTAPNAEPEVLADAPVTRLLTDVIGRTL